MSEYANYVEQSAFEDGLSVGRAEAKQLIKQLQQQVERECVWTKTVMGIYGEYDNWATSCGEDFAITEEWHEKPTPFCSNCGGKAVIVIGAR